MAERYPKRLIEVDLPIKRISGHSRREKTIRHGHISTLHIWWARRPLAACRAVICAALWPDPMDPLCPESFKVAARRIMTAWALRHAKLAGAESFTRLLAIQKAPTLLASDEQLRTALLDFVADYADWANATIPEYLETSRAITKAAHDVLGSSLVARPVVVDPFAGGGSIPIEAMRIGSSVFASDLNPIPVLINQFSLEDAPRYGAELIEQVRKWGNWIRNRAESELSTFYPADPNGALPLAYIWARTARCEAPTCGAEIPLLRSYWLSKKDGKAVMLFPVPDVKGKFVDFRILHQRSRHWVDQADEQKVYDSPRSDGTVRRGSATCPCCGYTTPAENVRRQVKAAGGGADSARLIAVLVETKTAGRQFRLPLQGDIAPVKAARAALEGIEAGATDTGLSPVPREELPYLRSIFNVQLIGVDEWGKLFSARQKLALLSISNAVRDVGRVILESGAEPGLARATQNALALVFGKLADRCNAFARWEPNVQCSQQLYGRQALGIVWDFGEVCPLRDFAGCWGSLLDVWCSGLPALIDAHLHASGADVTVSQADAASHPLPDDSADLLFTDPPYYDAVPYADLSDFFYVWLKRMLGSTAGELFRSELTPKKNEIVQLSERNPKYSYKTKVNFEIRMQAALSEGRRVVAPSGIAVIVFAHKATAAWETMLQAVVDAGWVIVGSWPIDTEMGSRLRAQNSATLSSSIHLVCRPRENPDGSLRDDEVGDWRDVLNELPRRIHLWMPRLAEEGVVGADAIFACLGPALEVFSRYSRVEKANGEPVTLREYLEQVWAAVAKEALAMVFQGADTTGFEPDARLTAMWLWTLSAGSAESGSDSDEDADTDDDSDSGAKKLKIAGYALEYDAARKIAQGLGASLENMPNLVEVSGDNARLLSAAERTKHLFGKEEAESPAGGRQQKKRSAQLDMFVELTDPQESEVVWSEKTVQRVGDTTLDRVHQSMILFAAGRSEALKRFLVEDGVGRDGRFWRLAQALSALFPANSDEKRWVDGVLARKKGLGF